MSQLDDDGHNFDLGVMSSGRLLPHILALVQRSFDRFTINLGTYQDTSEVCQ